MNNELIFALGFSGFFISLFIIYSFFIYNSAKLNEETKSRTRSFVSNAVFREYWYWVTAPAKNFLIKHDVHPNTLTWIGFLFAILSGYAFAEGKFAIGSYLLIFSATLDVLDGQVARHRQKNSKAGSFLDSTLDRLGEMFLFLGFIWYFQSKNEGAWVFITYVALSTSQLVSYARARAEGLGEDCKGGFFQRAERMIVITVINGFIPFFQLIGWEPEYFMKASMALVMIGSVQTAYYRVFVTYRNLVKKEN